MTSTLKIGGMTCQNCARHVRDALQQVPGVESAEIDLGAGRARVNAERTDVKALIEAVARAGYTAEPERIP